MKKTILISISILACLFLTQCDNELPLRNTEIACDSMYWKIIIPGVTTGEELPGILRSLSFVDQASIVDKGPWNIFDDEILFSFYTGELVRVRLLNHKVITVSYGSKTYGGDINMTFGEAVACFGEPEFMMKIPPEGELQDTYYYAISPNKGVSIGFNASKSPKKWRNEIRPEVVIDLLYLFSPESFELLVKAGKMHNILWQSEDIWERLIPWAGYGNLEELYPERRP